MNIKEKEFYSNVKNWDFSKINYTIETISNFDFYKTISNYSNSSSLCLDLGTGGGENLLKNYPEVGYIIATDISEEMLKTAKNNLKNYPNKKVKFILSDNLNLNFPNEMFDLISARHTQINYQLSYNILVKGGVLVIEGVDTKDCFELKEIFNRGQEFNSKEILSKFEYENLLKVGFQKVELFNYLFNEYYASKNDLLNLLMKTPIINEFETNKEIEDDLLEKYINKFTSDKGIKLKREYYGILAIK
jgi:ubiquinone/menaquinone biosynthesis C-methylase UbiE